ncbi:MAG: LuxR C-terminal-related transcriptional regulator, partial [Chloroflexota bacterium]
RVQDLRFEMQEGQQFLNQIMGVDLSEIEIRLLDQKTEGWVAGLQFVALSLQGMAQQTDRQRFIEQLTGRDRHMVDYLVEEVLHQQSAETQHFLRHTAVLDRLQASLCEAILEQANGQQTLEYLERANLFLIPLDNERRWYRYHHLFLDLLRQRLQQSVLPATIRQLHQRASQWYEAHQLIDEAIEHALKAEDYETVIRLLEPIAARLLWGRGAIGQLWHLLAQIPQEALQQSPQLIITGVWSHYWAHDRAGVEKYLGMLYTLDELPSTITGQVKAIEAVIALAAGDSTNALTNLQEAVSTISEDELDLLSFFRYGLGLTLYAHTMDLDEAQTHFKTSIDLAQENNNLFVITLSTGFLGIILQTQGRLHQAHDLYQKTLTYLENQDAQALPVSSYIHVWLANIYYEWNEVEKALKHVEKGIALGEQAQIGDAITNGYMLQATWYQDFGYIEKADQRLQQLKAWGAKIGLERVDAQIANAAAGIATKRQDWATVDHWLSTSGVDVTDRPQQLSEDHWRLLELLHARTYFDKDSTRLAGAIDLVDHLINLARNIGAKHDLISHSILKALIHQACNEHDLALPPLIEALQLGEPEGYCRTFLREGQPLMSLLQLALKRNIAPKYTHHLLQAFADESQRFASALTSPSPTLPDHIEPLTSREQEVLQQVAFGLTNLEIAETLVISLATVKRHISNIYSKLDVRHRTEAVALAQELDLFRE